MRPATHLIKISGTYDESKWNDITLKEYVKRKIQSEIEDVLHPSLELFKAENGDVNVWVYIRALPSEATQPTIQKWLEDHIKEEGVTVKGFMIEIVSVWWERQTWIIDLNCRLDF